MSTMTATVLPSTRRQTPRKINSYQANAPIAVTLNLLWKATRHARDFSKTVDMAGQDVSRLLVHLDQLHTDVETLDRRLKQATRFSPQKAEQDLKELCDKIMELTAPEALSDLIHIRFAHAIRPLREVAGGRLQRLASR